MNIEESYDSWSDQYDTNQNKTRDLDSNVTQNILSKYTYHNVLELGCGTGKNTIWHVKQGKAVTGLDFSAKMLEIARKKTKSFPTDFIQTDLNDNWPVDNRNYDLITSSLTLEHIDNLDHIFAQATMKLKNSGLFFISEYHPFKQYQGKGARFVIDQREHNLEVYIHHLSDYLDAAFSHDFKLLDINEWFDDNNKTDIPRLITFLFRKNHK